MPDKSSYSSARGEGRDSCYGVMQRSNETAGARTLSSGLFRHKRVRGLQDLNFSVCLAGLMGVKFAVRAVGYEAQDSAGGSDVQTKT